ncbi:hypothetical protein [Anabaena catenula]|uniref:Uncharacterized protein n=1 Tax=Anabaena catenula FACHB-362 TaxID=2692877 RepID=A0ABR8J889_9NOST|nr:hypothetical protein [Anabaena catenula]MBD2693810.1 hypothetical protein [Anabaena catenula FACHB-362]
MQIYLSEVQDYLSRFFKAKIQEYREDLKNLKPHQGYGFYYKHDEVGQALFNIVSNIEETFWDLRIPEAFSSPEQLINTLIRFRDTLSRQDTIFADVFDHYEIESKEPPIPVFEIRRINHEVLSAVNHALSLNEVETYLSEKTYQETGIQKAIDRLIFICQRFHSIAKQLELRRSDKGKIRETLKIKDEYDVQDLLYALLKIDFVNIRKEEGMPSFAGSSSRMDFLLKEEKIGIEVKKTRESLKDKEITTELAEDIIRYQSHPDCEYLLCFIYDPEGLLKNSEALIRDLSKSGNDKLTVRVIVNP